MAEPTSTTSVGIAALFIALFGPLAGEYAVIVFAALAGGMWALGRRETSGRLAGAWLLAKIVGAAVVLTSAIAIFIESHYQLPAPYTLAPIAFGIGFIGDNWQSLGTSCIDIVRNFLNRKGGQ